MDTMEYKLHFQPTSPLWRMRMEFQASNQSLVFGVTSPLSKSPPTESPVRTKDTAITWKIPRDLGILSRTRVKDHILEQKMLVVSYHVENYKRFRSSVLGTLVGAWAETIVYIFSHSPHHSVPLLNSYLTLDNQVKVSRKPILTAPPVC